jgi:hypothetical protein
MDGKKLKAGSVATEPLEVVWTNHAIDRAGQRFGFDPKIRIPNRKLGLVGATKAEGEEFDVHSGKVIYGCIRTNDIVLIRTVMNFKPKEVNDEPTTGGDARRRRAWEARKQAKNRNRIDFSEWEHRGTV